jgi:hypothetical protein
MLICFIKNRIYALQPTPVGLLFIALSKSIIYDLGENLHNDELHSLYSSPNIVTTSPLRSRWNTGPQQLLCSVAEVSVAFKFFIETGLVALCSNPQPGGPGLHIYIPCRLVGPVISPGTGYPF